MDKFATFSFECKISYMERIELPLIVDLPGKLGLEERYAPIEPTKPAVDVGYLRRLNAVSGNVFLPAPETAA